MIPEQPQEPNDFEVELTRQVVEALRPLGLTVEGAFVSKAIDPDSDEITHIFNFTAAIRPSAREKIMGDNETKQNFLKMMQDDANQRIKEQTKGVLHDIEDIEAALFGDDDDECCNNYMPHPSGFCMSCGKGMEE